MLRFSANLSTMFQELPLLERLPAARAAGFEAIEVWFPYEVDSARFAEGLKANNLICVGINSPAGNPSEGDWGLATEPDRVADFERSVHDSMQYAQAINCLNVHVMAGQPPAHIDQALAWDTYRSNLRRAIVISEHYGRSIMIEPLNALDRPRYLLQRQEQAISIIDELGRDRIGLMLDLFHLQRGEGNLVERMRHSLPYATHVQIADVPGRHEPGTGEIRFEKVFEELAASWSGWVGCEYIPQTDTLSGLGWMKAFRA